MSEEDWGWELPEWRAAGEIKGVTDVRAPWASRPCELVTYHAPKPTITEGHHIHPVFLQNRLYGNIQDNELKYLCANCHDSVHEWLYWLLGARKRKPVVGRAAKLEASNTYRWFESEWIRLHPTRGWLSTF